MVFTLYSVIFSSDCLSGTTIGISLVCSSCEFSFSVVIDAKSCFLSTISFASYVTTKET